MIEVGVGVSVIVGLGEGLGVVVGVQVGVGVSVGVDETVTIGVSVKFCVGCSVIVGPDTCLQLAKRSNNMPWNKIMRSFFIFGDEIPNPLS